LFFFKNVLLVCNVFEDGFRKNFKKVFIFSILKYTESIDLKISFCNQLLE
jgi:hypothetical protein